MIVSSLLLLLSTSTLDAVGVDEHPGSGVPPEMILTDEAGRKSSLGQLTSDAPVVLVLAYYRCPMLCGLVLRGLGRSAMAVGDFARAVRYVTVSIDPRDTVSDAARAKKTLADEVGKDGASLLERWHFAVAEPHDVEALADRIGFRYALDVRTGEYAHPALVTVLARHGRVARYLYGIELPPRDLALAIVEAGQGRIGSVAHRAVLACYRFDPSSRRYRIYLEGLLRGGGVAILVGIASLALLVRWRSRRQGQFIGPD